MEMEANESTPREKLKENPALQEILPTTSKNRNKSESHDITPDNSVRKGDANRELFLSIVIFRLGYYCCCYD